MRNTTSNRRSIALFLAAFATLLASGPGLAQDIEATVNGEQITSSDVDQRMRWNAMTHNLGNRMKAKLTGGSVKQKYRQMMVAANPQSQDEARAAAERIKNQLIDEAKREAMAEGGGIPRKAVVNQLIEERLKIQASKKLGIEVSDAEVEEALQARVGGGGDHKKAKTEAFFEQFEKSGITRSSVREVFRVQLAWRAAVRLLWGRRLGTIPRPPLNAQDHVQYDVEKLRLAASDPSDTKTASERMKEAENLKAAFHSCAGLAGDVQGIPGASIEAMNKVMLADFPKDAQPLIEKSSEGQMTPPVLTGDAVEVYAVCGKKQLDPNIAAFENLSRSYLQELREKASIDIRA